jgi:hypothetical protein
MSAPKFPYPSDEWIGTPSDNPKNHSGCYGGEDTEHVKTWQKKMKDRGWSIGVDGCYGSESESVCEQFQKEKGLAVDGKVGPKTWDKTWSAPVTNGGGGGGSSSGGGDTGPDDGTRHRLSEHFIVEEFDCHDGTKVPSTYYDALEYLCDVFLEPLRKSYGSVTINSGYRTPSHNASVGGEPNSFHIYTAHDDDDPAADVACASGSASQWHSKLNSIRQSERNGNGGLGKYSSFVHIDLRDYPSDWTG